MLDIFFYIVLRNFSKISLRGITRHTSIKQGAKKIIFTACHLGKLKLAFTSPDVISTSPKNFLTSRIDFSSSSVIGIPQKTSLARHAS